MSAQTADQDAEASSAEVYETYAWSADAPALSAALAERYSPAARTIYVASSASWTDALAGTPLTVGGALFLVDPEASALTELPVDDEDEAREVVIFGGPAVVSPAVEVALQRQFPNAVVERVAGADRYDTAARLAMRSGPADTVLLASGQDYPDALSAGAAAAKVKGAVLLTERGRLPSATAGALQALGAEDVHVIGGEEAIGPTVVAQLEDLGLDVRRISGADRYLTALEVTQSFFRGHDTQAFVADGNSFQAAVITSSSAANVGAPLLLKRPDCTPQAVNDYLSASGMAWVENAAIEVPGGVAPTGLDQAC